MENILKIAVGARANTKQWKNQELTWHQVATKLSEPVVTKETMEQYKIAPKGEKSRIKDVGGYVGGYLSGGKRSPSTVVCRSLITLDIDYADEETLERVKYALPYAFVIHSTHSHRPDEPRYRLILPLDRDVTVSEYVPIARRIAEYIDIEAFDETGYQPYRLMFWPSVSKDAEYYYYENPGQPVPTDIILGTYVDFNDVSAWPTSKAWAEELKTGMEKLEDPLQKPGVIGGFCRTYDIHEAIAQFIPEAYTPMPNAEGELARYTYTQGSTAGGLVVYDDIFAYSHHGTDPISGRCVNAYDLVRIHKFGQLDTGSTIKKSMEAMDAFILAETKVAKTLTEERIAAVADKFGDSFLESASIPAPGEAPPEVGDDYDPDEWMEDLDRNKQGKVLNTAGNYRLIFTKDPRIAGKIKFNIFDQFFYVFPGVPWRTVTKPERSKNVDLSGMRSYIEIMYGISSAPKIKDALLIYLEENTYDPVRDYLNEAAEAWDGENRLDTLLHDYLGAPKNVYTAQAMRTWMKGAVARTFSPGIKFDLVLTLVGEQGVGKSTFFAALGGEWFSDSFSTFYGKESIEQLQGSWIVEMAELSAMGRTTVEAAKHFITQCEDKYRPAYKEMVEWIPRRCIFGATQNKREFLRDPTGNRRFLPVDTDINLASEDVFDLRNRPEFIQQLWGEAVQSYRKDSRLFLTGEANNLAKQEQTAHAFLDARIALIHEYVNMPLPEDWDARGIPERRSYVEMYDPETDTTGEARKYVCSLEIWCEAMGHSQESFDRKNAIDITELLTQIPGWRTRGKSRRFKNYGKQRYYERKE
jgi:putative DNA primase/helicase